MANICLDTDIIVDLLRNRNNVKEFMEQYEDIHTFATTYVNLFELYYGTMLSNNRKLNIESVKRLEERLILLNLSKEAVLLAGQLAAELEQNGMKLDHKDILIASIVKTENWILKTNNLRYFSRINGLLLFED